MPGLVQPGHARILPLAASMIRLGAKSTVSAVRGLAYSTTMVQVPVMYNVTKLLYRRIAALQRLPQCCRILPFSSV